MTPRRGDLRALAPGVTLAVAVAAANYAVTGRPLWGWLDASERLLPFAVVSGIFLAAYRLAVARSVRVAAHEAKAAALMAVATGLAAALLFVPPLAALDAQQKLYAGIAVWGFAGIAALPRRAPPRLVCLLLSALIGGVILAAGNILLAALIGVAWLSRGLYLSFAATLVAVGYSYGGVGSGAAMVLGGLLLLAKTLFWGDDRVAETEESVDGAGRAGVFGRRARLRASEAVRG